jgi:glycosyltransferase involved in cell wall biosynthesis
MRLPILHVIPFLWSGAGGVVTRLCEAQRRNGPVVIVTTGRTAEHEDWPSYRARLRRAGVTHHTIDFFHREAGLFWQSTAALATLLRELRPAVIHAHAGVPCCGAIAARDLAGLRMPVIGQMYSWGPDRPEWMNQQDMWGFGRADRVICSARAYQDLLVRYGVPVRKLVYLPWGLPLERLPWRGAGAVAEEDPVTLGFVGRIETRKGQLELVETLARLRKRLPRARLELVGPVADRDYATRVRTAIAHHGLESSVTLLGEVPDIAAHLKRWSLFVSLSADEGQGLAALEAMAVGVPVVARRVAGIDDFLADGRTGYAIESASISAAATVVRRAARDPRRRSIARQARRLVERRYDWPDTVTAFDAIYRESRTIVRRDN